MSRWVRDRAEYEHGSKWFADWHRERLGDLCTMIDIDCYGYCPRCFQPVYIVEATRSRRRKPATVCEHLSTALHCVLFVAYRDEAKPNSMLLDDRTTPHNYGWIADREALSVFATVRASHVCVLGAVAS